MFDFNEEIVFGEIVKAKQEGEDDNTKEIVLRGKLDNFLFVKKVIFETIKFSGKTYQLVKDIIEQNLVVDKDSVRYIDIDIQIDDEEYLRELSSDITKQITGGYIWDEVEKLLSQDNLGIFFKPIVETNHLDSDGNVTNISRWELIISAGKDRTKGNDRGLSPVLFSQQLSNITKVDYEYDTEKYTNCAYVAGEGEDEDRKWFEIERDENNKRKGWNRKELWIDARDLQSEDAETGEVLSEEQYRKLVVDRTNEKFSENGKIVSYDSTITETNKQYIYGEDYTMGDWCTVFDTDLKKEMNVQITEVTKTIQGAREIVDIKFSYGSHRKDKMKQVDQNSEQLQQLLANIRYLETQILKLKG